MAIITIKKNRAFRRVFANGRSRADKLLVVYRLANGTDECRFGFTVSRKLGGAVVRNRVRRRLKEICRRHQERFVPGYDYVVVARPMAAQVDYQGLENSLLKLAGNLSNRERSRSSRVGISFDDLVP
jgi:ribonuclease P protein component